MFRMSDRDAQIRLVGPNRLTRIIGRIDRDHDVSDILLHCFVEYELEIRFASCMARDNVSIWVPSFRWCFGIISNNN